MAKSPEERPKTLTIALGEPVEFKGETYKSLTFGRLKAKHLAASDAFKGNVEKHLAMLAGMANVPIPVIQDLEVEDYERISNETVPLMGNSIAAAAAAKQEATPTSP